MGVGARRLRLSEAGRFLLLSSCTALYRPRRPRDSPLYRLVDDFYGEAAIFGVLLREEILEEVGHAQWVFTIPKLIRPYFLHHRELLGKLSQAAWETVQELMAEAGGDDGEVRPGMVSVMQTATDLLEWHPHAQYLALSTPLFSYRSVP